MTAATAIGRQSIAGAAGTSTMMYAAGMSPDRIHTLSLSDPIAASGDQESDAAAKISSRMSGVSRMSRGRASRRRTNAATTKGAKPPTIAATTDMPIPARSSRVPTGPTR
jgi:hypothetical protein